jgi:hypothetical protein
MGSSVMGCPVRSTEEFLPVRTSYTGDYPNGKDGAEKIAADMVDILTSGLAAR